MHSRSILALGIAAVLWASPAAPMAAVSTTADGAMSSIDERADLRGDGDGGQIRPAAAGANTGVRNLDMLLEMQNRGAEGVPAAESTRQLAPRPRESSAAVGVAAKRDLAPMDDDDESSAPTRERRWTAASTEGSAGGSSAQAPSGGESNDSASTGYRGDLHGLDLARTPLRKLLLFLRDNREWVGVAVATLVLGMLTLRASSRRGRRRA